MESKVYKAPQRIDRNSSEEVQEFLDALVDSGITDLVVDMSDMQYISSAGLRVLVATQKRLMNGGKFALKNVPAFVKETLDLTGLSAMMPILKEE